MANYIVGRNPDVAIPHILVSGDTTVSSKHCVISPLGDGWFRIDDSSSTNGTFVKEQGGWRRVTSAKVRVEDQIRLGQHVTTVAKLISSAVEVKSKGRPTRNPETGEIEYR
jgi:predicted component of type VI protein secretion system